MLNGGQQLRPSARNTLYLDIPGFPSTLQVRFPDCRLPVCGRCKKNYKTRDMCRTQGGHTTLPWSTVFICMTLDHTCIDANNNIKNGTFTSRNIEWMPYCYKSDVNSETLICAACKTKNYTRKQCRIKSRHRYLPWSTVYVVLSCEDGDDPRSATFNRRDIQSNIQRETSAKRRSTAEDNNKGQASKRRADGVDVPSYLGEDDDESEEEKESSSPDLSTKKKKTSKSDDITKVDKSRTFLVEVDEESCVVKWLDFDRSKAMPMQFYSSLPSQPISRSPFSGQTVPSVPSVPSVQSVASASLYPSLPSRLYQIPTDNIQNSSQFFQMDNPARQYMQQILPQQQAQFPSWQGANIASNITSMNHPANVRQLTEEPSSDFTPNWYNDHYDQQLQVQVQAQMQAQAQVQAQNNSRTWANYVSPTFDGNQMMASNLVPLQQGRAQANLYQTGAYQESDQDTGQYNIPQSYQYHGQF